MSLGDLDGWDCRIGCGDWFEDRYLLDGKVRAWIDSYRKMRRNGDGQFRARYRDHSDPETIWRKEELFAFSINNATKTLTILWPVPVGWGY